jgi:hypothetical protein
MPALPSDKPHAEGRYIRHPRLGSVGSLEKCEREKWIACLELDRIVKNGREEEKLAQTWK